MRTLACLAAVILAGVPAAAAPLLIDDIPAIGLLPVEQLLTGTSLTAVDRDRIGNDTSTFAPSSRFVVVRDAYRSNMTRDLPRVDDDDFAVPGDSIELADGSGDLSAQYAQGLTPLEISEEGPDADAREGTASARESLDASAAPGQRDVERAALWGVQPAALTLLGVCLALAIAGGRDWHRRNWHRRPMRRRS